MPALELDMPAPELDIPAPELYMPATKLDAKKNKPPKIYCTFCIQI